MCKNTRCIRELRLHECEVVWHDLSAGERVLCECEHLL
jgi:hypothetical protein